MKFKSILKQFVYIKKAKHTTAIIVAAGSGARMCSDIAKQHMELGGMSVVARSIAAFENCSRIKDMVIVARADESEIYSSMIKKYGFKKIIRIVKGGDTRQQSVLNGFKAIDGRCDYVAIHDAARCLITPENIEKVLKNAERYEAAGAACPVKDTIKICNGDGFVVSTPDRNLTWAAQTPQIFRADLYRAAAFYALKQGYEATDDNALIEYLGAKVKMVDCGYENIKITTPEDIHIASVLLELRGNHND